MSSRVHWAEEAVMALERGGLVRMLFGKEALVHGIIYSPSETEKVKIGKAWEWCGGRRLVKEVLSGDEHKTWEVVGDAHWAVEVLGDVDEALEVGDDDHAADRMELPLEP